VGKMGERKEEKKSRKGNKNKTNVYLRHGTKVFFQKQETACFY